MSKKDMAVFVDVSAPLAAKIEEAITEYEGRYTPDFDVYKRLLEVYKKFGKLMYLNNGRVEIPDVKDVSIIKIAAKVPELDLYRDRLKLFRELLGMVDHFEAYAFDEDNLIVKVGVIGLWKAV